MNKDKFDSYLMFGTSVLLGAIVAYHVYRSQSDDRLPPHLLKEFDRISGENDRLIDDTNTLNGKIWWDYSPTSPKKIIKDFMDD